MMRQKFFLQMCLEGVCLLFFTGCFSMPVPYASDPAAFRFAEGPESGNTDYSYPVTGGIAETGAIVYTRLPVSESNTEIQVSGTLYDREHQTERGLARLHSKNPNGTIPVYFFQYWYHYIWKGAVSVLNDGITTNTDALLDIDVIGEKDIRVIDLLTAKTQDTQLVFEYFVSESVNAAEGVPVRWGVCTFNNRTYDLYAVVETDYRQKYPDFSEEERAKAKWLAKSRIDTYGQFFLKQGQKFQLLDGRGVVAAEITGNSYTIYDTLPQSEWVNMKQSIALFYTFRLIVQRVFTGSGGYISF